MFVVVSDSHHPVPPGSASQDNLLTSPHQYYSSGEVWFRAAVIAVPITGTVILVLLVLIALRILRSDVTQQRPLKRAPSFVAPAPFADYTQLRGDDSLQSVVTVDDVTHSVTSQDYTQQQQQVSESVPRVRLENVACRQQTCSLAQHMRDCHAHSDDLDLASRSAQTQTVTSSVDEATPTGSCDVARSDTTSHETLTSALLTDELCTSAAALRTHNALSDDRQTLVGNS